MRWRCWIFRCLFQLSLLLWLMGNPILGFGGLEAWNGGFPFIIIVDVLIQMISLNIE